MQAVFRIASPDDANHIATLVNQAYRPSARQRGWTHEAQLVSGPRTSTAQVLSLFAPRSSVLVLSLDLAIVACVHVEGGPSGAYIGMLATDPACQAQGLGKRMLRHAEQYAVEHFGATRFKMSVLSSRPELLAFYERRGYARTGAIEAYPVSAGVGTPTVEGLHLDMLVKDAGRAGAVSG